MEFRVLNATGGEGRVWSRLLDRLPPELRDLHFLPEYGLIYQAAYGHEPRLACAIEGDACAVQPFVVRRLNDLPFLACQRVAEPYHDIANAYGYGGPLCSDPGSAVGRDLLAVLDEGLRSWCADRHIAAEFCSLHPLLDGTRLVAGWQGVSPRAEKSVVWLDLVRDEEQLWRAVHRGHRSSISHARRSGVTVERVPTDARHFGEFERLYAATMERRRAAERWRFPAAYFRDCTRLLGAARTALFFARTGTAVAAAYFLLHDSGIAYYHFGGSDEACFELRPNNLLLFETALWARRAGNRIYHLGGGVTADEHDSLLRFKSGFGGARATLHTYGRVHDRGTYERLCELKCAHELATLGRVLEADYFPLYRRAPPPPDGMPDARSRPGSAP